jgi:hypothetical protein
VLLTSKCTFDFIVYFTPHFFFWHSNIMLSYKDKGFDKWCQTSELNKGRTCNRWSPFFVNIKWRDTNCHQDEVPKGKQYYSNSLSTVWFTWTSSFLICKLGEMIQGQINAWLMVTGTEALATTTTIIIVTSGP